MRPVAISEAAGTRPRSRGFCPRHEDRGSQSRLLPPRSSQPCGGRGGLRSREDLDGDLGAPLQLKIVGQEETATVLDGRGQVEGIDRFEVECGADAGGALTTAAVSGNTVRSGAWKKEV